MTNNVVRFGLPIKDKDIHYVNGFYIIEKKIDGQDFSVESTSKQDAIESMERMIRANVYGEKGLTIPTQT